MLEEDILRTDLIEISPHLSEFRRFSRVFRRRGVVVFGIIVILLLISTAIFAPWIAPYDPYKQNLNHILLPPSWEHCWAPTRLEGIR